MARFDQDEYNLRRSVIRKATLFAFLFSLVMFGFGLNGRQPLGALQKPADDVSAKILTVLSMPARGFEKTLNSVSNHFNVVEENERLRVELARLSQIENQDLALKEQVDYLESILMTQIIIGGEQGQVAARAVSENDGPFVKSALINAGQKQGVKAGQAEMTEHGLYGRVVRIGSSSARVLLLTDLNSRIPVLSLRSRSRAILSGANEQSPQLDFRGDGDWQIDDKVITSGDDGALPRGLPVGTVIALPEGGLGVALYMDQAPVDWVQILLFDPTLTPEVAPATATGSESVTELDQEASEAASQAEGQSVTAVIGNP